MHYLIVYQHCTRANVIYCVLYSPIYLLSLLLNKHLLVCFTETRKPCHRRETARFYDHKNSSPNSNRFALCCPLFVRMLLNFIENFIRKLSPNRCGMCAFWYCRNCMVLFFIYWPMNLTSRQSASHCPCTYICVVKLFRPTGYRVCKQTKHLKQKANRTSFKHTESDMFWLELIIADMTAEGMCAVAVHTVSGISRTDADGGWNTCRDSTPIIVNASPHGYLISRVMSSSFPATEQHRPGTADCPWLLQVLISHTELYSP